MRTRKIHNHSRFYHTSQSNTEYGDHSNFFFSGLFFAFSRAEPTAYGGSEARRPIGVVATSLHQSHSNVGAKFATTAHGNAIFLTH